LTDHQGLEGVIENPGKTETTVTNFNSMKKDKEKKQ